MSKRFGLKRIMACAAAFVLTTGVAGSGIRYTSAQADYETDANAQSDYFYEGSDMSVPQTENPDGEDGNSDGEDDNTGYDITVYAERLREIAEKQQQLEDEISQAETDIESEKKTQKILQKKIDALNEKIEVLNGYMTALEIEISTNKRELEDTQRDIEEGVEGLKKRLRAMYIAGSDSYTTMILESDSFYDVLMRMELIKRVAKHDDEMISNLYELQDKYEAEEAALKAKQEEYDEQYAQYETEKASLDELYQSSEETRKQLEEKQKELEEENKAFNDEKSQYESDLSGILKSSGTTARDDEVRATMALADVKLGELRDGIRERLKNNEQLEEFEPTYTFSWPVPGCYNITSGVGARWGSYHSGLDIAGAHGTEIHASDSGTVLRINTTCTHDYGKSSSCGCGGGYGNYVIIDHGNEFITLYGHLTEVDVNVGDEIKKGDVIGKMGSTGFSTGDHLHFEIRYQGYILNPAYYVDVAN